MYILLKVATLPARAGYVEDVDLQGERFYRPTAQKTAEEASKLLQVDLATEAIDAKYRILCLEMGVTP